eukprot:1192647-Prorocentrum_minimum.AAC.3
MLNARWGVACALAVTGAAGPVHDKATFYISRISTLPTQAYRCSFLVTSVRASRWGAACKTPPCTRCRICCCCMCCCQNLGSRALHRKPTGGLTAVRTGADGRTDRSENGGRRTLSFK